MSTTTLTLATVRRVYEFLSRLTLVRRTSGAMGASVRSQVSCAPATQECCMACGMHIRNNIVWYAGKIACTKHAPICFYAAGQASSLPARGDLGLSRASCARAWHAMLHGHCHWYAK